MTDARRMKLYGSLREVVSPKGLLYSCVGLVVLAVVVWVVIRGIINHTASQEATKLLHAAGFSSDPGSADADVERLTRLIHLAMVQSRSSNPMPFLIRLRPYLTHRLLPAPLRLDEGGIELIYLRGNCDNIARGLGFLLKRAGIQAKQINFVTPSAAHSAVLAQLEGGRQVLLDPFFGIVAKHEGRLLGPAEARSLAQQGARSEALWYKVDASADSHFYEQFASASFALQGERMEIAAEIQLPSGDFLQLGTQNGDSGDVSRDAAAAGLTPYWHYLGSRYDRAWIRKLHFTNDMRVIVGVTERPDARYITSPQRPDVGDRTLIYDMEAGETLVFEDGRAGYDWLRLRGYQDVDYIRFSSR